MQPVGLSIGPWSEHSGKRWHAHAAPFPGGILPKYLLRLFVTGASSRTATAIANLRRICEQELPGQYDLEIIDVLQFPDMAEDEKILATPTLIKSLPLPLRRVIGDLSDTQRVLLGLEVHAQPASVADARNPEGPR
jgi:circadian clock protein KaiB